MTQLIASYATDRYIIRLVQPDDTLPYSILIADSPSGMSFEQADEERFERYVAAARTAEDNYWRALLAEAKPGDRALFFSSWERFRAYAGLPAPRPEEIPSGNDHTQDSRGSDEGADEEA